MNYVQPSLFGQQTIENTSFLSSQLITYIGNKRSLLPFLEAGVLHAKEKLQKSKISFLDLFSGSGIVARMARQHAEVIHCNDLELYSHVTNSCYQHNFGPELIKSIATEVDRVKKEVSRNLFPGVIAELYAPADDNNIKDGERVFYTRRNAMFLDTFMEVLKSTPTELRGFLLAPILSQASIHTNTSGVFKGFYKNKDGIGQFGGTGKNALSRILRPIDLHVPVHSNFHCQEFLHNCDANTLVAKLEPIDVAYFDPPYNQHPYGSNYFMLNLLCDYARPKNISRVSGIPTDWKRSKYNKQNQAATTLLEAVKNVPAKFVLISYNSEGFIKHETFISELMKLGQLSVMDTKYNTFRGCRNLSGRDIHVTEFLYLLEKN